MQHKDGSHRQIYHKHSNYVYRLSMYVVICTYVCTILGYKHRKYVKVNEKIIHKVMNIGMFVLFEVGH